MKVIRTERKTGETIPHSMLEPGEVYYVNGTPDAGKVDSSHQLMMFTDEGSLVGLELGDYYPANYGSGFGANALSRWTYMKADVELMEYADESGA